MLRVVNNGTTKFFVDEDGDVDCGDITCNNLTYTTIGGGVANDIIDWSSIVADEISMTANGADPNGDVSITSALGNIILSAPSGAGAGKVQMTGNNHAYLASGVGAGGDYLLLGTNPPGASQNMPLSDNFNLMCTGFGWILAQDTLYLWQNNGEHRIDFTSSSITADVSDDLFVIKGNHSTDSVSPHMFNNEYR